MSPNEVADALDQTLDSIGMRLLADSAAAGAADGNRDYLDADERHEVRRCIEAGLDAWRPRTGLHARIDALCSLLDIKVMP